MKLRALLSHSGVAAIVVLAAIPLVLWALGGSLPIRFASFASASRSVGQIAGLAGMALFAMGLIIEGRFRFVEPYFGGINRLYNIHHTVGALAFTLLLVHPLSLAAQYIPISVQYSMQFLVSLNDVAIDLGKAALALMAALLAITFYAALKHETWRATHRWLGFAFFFGGLHAFLVGSDVTRYKPLFAYMLALVVLGLGAWLWRAVLRLYTLREYPYRVADVKRINDNVVSIALAPEGKTFRHKPGQFAFVRFDGLGSRFESHPFSFTSASSDSHISFCVKAVGDFTSMLYLLKPGAAARLEGPFGVFSYTRGAFKRQLWIAGGIGITPFLSMVRSLKDEPDREYRIDLYYTVVKPSDAVMLGELKEIAARDSRFRVIEHFSGEQGYLTADAIAKSSDGVDKTSVFLCGPPPFMHSLTSQLRRLGVRARNIYTEEFRL